MTIIFTEEIISPEFISGYKNLPEYRFAAIPFSTVFYNYQEVPDHPINEKQF